MKIQEWKKKEVEDIKKLIEEYPIFGIVDLENLPTLQYQRIRKGLKNAKVRMVKKRLIKIALEQLKEKKKNIDVMNEKIKGMPALIFTKDNPFKLSKLLDKNKSKAYAKAGQVAPHDIVIPSGPTSFAPGPIIGELGSFGIKTEVKEGKVAVREEKLLVGGGEEISAKIASLLQQLGIEPMEVGLNLVAVYENGVVFDNKILAVDEKEYISNIQLLHSEAFNLAIKIAYMNKETIKFLLQKAFRESNLIADKQNILTSENVKKVLSKADKGASFLKEKLNISDKVKVREVKVEAKKEEKKPMEDIKLKTNSYEDYKKKKEMTTEKLLKEDNGG